MHITSDTPEAGERWLIFKVVQPYTVHNGFCKGFCYLPFHDTHMFDRKHKEWQREYKLFKIVVKVEYGDGMCEYMQLFFTLRKVHQVNHVPRIVYTIKFKASSCI